MVLRFIAATFAHLEILQIMQEETIKEFHKSWKSTEAYYGTLINTDSGFEHFIPLYLFIQKLRAEGMENDFRLSTAMQQLVFSRSINDELRTDQKSIKLKVMEDSYEITLLNGKKMSKQYTIKELEDDRFNDLLITLKEEPIN